MVKKKIQKINYATLLLVASFVGLVASFWQTTERVHMLKYPNDPLSCNLSPVVDCGGVLGDRLSAVFGPPNALIGVVIFTLLFAFALQRVSGGSWSQLVRKVVVTLSIVIMLFSLWFFWVSLYVFSKICIFCVFIWIVSMPIGVYGAKDYLETIKNPQGLFKWKRDFLSKNALTVTVALYGLLIVLFFLKFQDYYFG